MASEKGERSLAKEHQTTVEQPTSKPPTKEPKFYHNIWYSTPKVIRKCEDGDWHKGELELVTWGGKNIFGELGWAAPSDEVDMLKNKFEVEMVSEHAKFLSTGPWISLDLLWYAWRLQSGM